MKTKHMKTKRINTKQVLGVVLATVFVIAILAALVTFHGFIPTLVGILITAGVLGIMLFICWLLEG